MHWEEFAGLRLPKCVGGDPTLDFCNTWAGWGLPPNPRREWLTDYRHFAVWAWYAGLVTEDASGRLRRLAENAPEDGARVLGQARELRAALYPVLLGRAEPDAFATVAEHAERAAAASTFALVAPGDASGEDAATSPAARWELPEDCGLSLPLMAVANAAAALLTAPDRPRIDACPGDDCGWLFLNSRGRRRWCSMSSCGNRTKVRAHAKRRREGDGTR